MKKFFISIIFMAIFYTSTAYAVDIGFENINAKITIPDDYAIVMPNNLESSLSIVQNYLGLEDLQADFDANGILAQAYKNDTVIQISAITDDNIASIFDVDNQDEKARGEYRVSFYPKNLYVDKGYEYKSSSWKNFGKGLGRFLILNYTHYNNQIKDYSAAARKTIKNGYEITVEIKALNRNVTTEDIKELNRIFKTFEFTKIVDEMDIAPLSNVRISEFPSEETKNRSVSIKGYAEQGTELKAVVMSLGDKEPMLVNVVANEKNQFEIPITFNKQGVFLITLTALKDDVEIGEWAYPVTYREGLLAVKFNNDIPDVVLSNDLTISGTAEPGAQIQVLINGGTVSRKSVNNEGKFSFKIDTKDEGEYEFVAIFTKKNLQTRRFKFSFVKKMSEEDLQLSLKKSAKNVTYTDMFKNDGKLYGKNVKFNVFVTEIIQSENPAIAKVAYKKVSGKYGNLAYFISQENISDELIDKKISGVAEYLGTYDNNTELTLENAENLPVLKVINIE